jgi:hypothetical protein
MPVFIRDNVRILYIHVPKTGGTSLERFFVANRFHMQYFDTGGRKESLNTVRWCPPQHMHAEMLHAIFDVTKFNYVFMTVRDPFSRLISEYKMRRVQSKNNIDDLNPWIMRAFNGYRRNRCVLGNHVRPQIDFLVANCDVRRLEDGYDLNWLAALSEKLSVRFEHMVVDRVQESSKVEIPRMDEDVTAAVREFYKEDFLRFQYNDRSIC